MDDLAGLLEDDCEGNNVGATDGIKEGEEDGLSLGASVIVGDDVGVFRSLGGRTCRSQTECVGVSMSNKGIKRVRFVVRFIVEYDNLT